MGFAGGREEILAKISTRIRRRDINDVVDAVFGQAVAEAGVDGMQYVATTGEGEDIPFATGRFVRQLRSLEYGDVIFVDGGLAGDKGLVKALADEFAGLKSLKGPVPEIAIHEDSIFAGAIGAAIWGSLRPGSWVWKGWPGRRVEVGTGVGSGLTSPGPWNVETYIDAKIASRKRLTPLASTRPIRHSDSSRPTPRSLICAS